MASIMDQYEQAWQKPKPTSLAGPLTSSGYVSVQLEDDTPIFSKQKLNFNPSDSLTHVAVSGDNLVVAMANSKLFRMDLKQPDKHEEIYFGKSMQSNSKLSAIFLDPLGCHLLLSFVPKNSNDGYPELMYLQKKVNKFRSVNKTKNYEVTEVGWNYENTSENTTGSILLGTSKGLILETEISIENDKMFQSGIEQYWKQVFDIGKGKNIPITGIEFHRLPSSSKYFIFVTTPTRLYQFVGYVNYEDKPLLQQIFNSYLKKPETGFQEILSPLKYSKLQFYFDKVKKSPKTFAWLTGSGIFYGQIDPTTQENSNSLLADGQLLDYPPVNNDSLTPGKVQKAPLSFVLTEFHVLLLYSDHVKALSLLNHELVYEEYYSESFGKLLDIVKDSSKQIIWVITEKVVFRYKTSREERNVWRIYCEKNMFDLAKMYCDNNPAHIDYISIKEAELLFENGEFENSAKIYASTRSSFENICLKFLQSDKLDALKIYLKERLNNLLPSDKTQITMVVVWVVELYMSQLGLLRRQGKENSQEYNQVQKEFESFLDVQRVKDCILLNKTVIYDLMASHGDKQNLIRLTIMNEDYENVISQNIYKKSYLEALEVLKKQSKPDLFYQFSSVLLQEVPKQTVNALISQGRKLSPVKLLPALISCSNDKEHVAEIIRFLEFLVQQQGCNERSIHNYLLSLYVEHNVDALTRYLAREGKELDLVHFDVHYALRLCRVHNLTEACVELSALLGLWETAVEMAIAVNLDLAEKIADMPEDEDVDLKKKLWLKIAQHVISSNQDVKEAMTFLHKCDLIKIEDILPFFSDVVTIDHFKEPICEALQEYNQQIEDLKVEMEDATRSADQVRGEIQSFRNRSAIVAVGDACTLCDLALLLRPFYLFPCGHRYHADCLMAEMQPLLGPAKRNKLSDLQKQLNSQQALDVTSTTPGGILVRDQIRNDIDDIVASECLYCGEYMIQSIDKPFIAEADWERVMKEWE